MRSENYPVIATDSPKLTVGGFPVAMSADAFGMMADGSSIVDDVTELRSRMETDGYLYLPALLDRDQVTDVRRAVTSQLAAIGILDPTYPADDAIAATDYKHDEQHRLSSKVSALKSMLYSGRMTQFFERFLGGPVAHFDYTWLRTVAPGLGTRSHCDIVYMGRGSRNLYTAWTPIGDVDLHMGGLMVLEGSHRHDRLRKTYCTRDVDSYCLNRERGAAERERDGSNGWLAQDPRQLQRVLGGRWRTHDYKAGDVVVFSTYTVHCGLDNHTNRVRISTDSRYQSAHEPRDDRWIGEDPIAHGAAGKRGKVC